MTTLRFDPSYVRPLGTVESQLLQVLVDRFRIIRKGQGFELQIDFNDDTPTIWLREAKRQLRAMLPRKQRIAVQQKIDQFIASDEGDLHYDDPAFPFRLGNGGTLPIVRMAGTDYYCLFYRDSEPTGWNIANGGANTRHDLLHPDAIIERELREELIIVEPEAKRWHIFDWHDACLHDHADFALAQELWIERFRHRGFKEFENTLLPLKWSLPPDADYQPPDQRQHDAVRIRHGDSAAIYTGQGFLNINAEDFGIEFDRIAKLAVGPQAIFCDGELEHGRELLDRVVGLFSVDKVLKEIGSEQHHFVPDLFYWNGENRTGEDLIGAINAFLKPRGSSLAQLTAKLRQQSEPGHSCDPMDLCPVTRTIIGRHKMLREAAPDPESPIDPFKIFISFASEDRLLARPVFRKLSTKMPNGVFFSDLTHTRGGFAEQIDHALDTAVSFVAVGTSVDHLKKSWVAYEWRNFHGDMMSNRNSKTRGSPFFAFISGINPNDLPRPLREQSAVVLENFGSLEEALAQTAERVAKR
jgi:hypothetical protein